ncbi:MAG: hypothetical protein QOK28_3549 [Actinomycetota bacterium]|jgi:hypothetical protein
MFRRLGPLRVTLLALLALIALFTIAAGTTGIRWTTWHGGHGVRSGEQWLLVTSHVAMAITLVILTTIAVVVVRSGPRS